jgi:PHP family Zn ribbon phosphoesterase
MQEKWRCINCKTEYTIEDLEDNFDGICDDCGGFLEKVGEHTNFKYTHAIQKNKYQESLQIMIQGIKMGGQDKIWHNVELVKDVNNRIKERSLFFKSLEILNQKFELWE